MTGTFNWPDEIPVAPADPTACMCGCPERDHEKAGATSRSSMRFQPGRRNPSFYGTNRYCHSPLCCCIEYVPRAAHGAQ